MDFASKFNKTSFGIDTKDFGYVKLAEVAASSEPSTVHPINGMWVRNSQLGDSPVIIDAENKRLVNLPSHLGATVRDILADPDAVETTKQGKVGYTIYSYESHGKTCYGINFVNK